MATLILSAPLAARLEGRKELEVTGGTTSAVLRDLEVQKPELRGWILDERGHIREHVNVFVNGALAALETPVGRNDAVQIVQAISGG